MESNDQREIAGLLDPLSNGCIDMEKAGPVMTVHMHISKITILSFVCRISTYQPFRPRSNVGCSWPARRAKRDENQSSRAG